MDIKDERAQFPDKQAILDLLKNVNLSELNEKAAGDLCDMIATRLDSGRRKPHEVATVPLLAFTVLSAQYKIPSDLSHKLIERLIDAFVDGKVYAKEFAEEAKRWYNDRKK